MNKNLIDFVSLNKQSKKPLYVQLYDEIAEKIKCKTLSAGYKLPPVRILAQQLNINNGTVVSAYRELEKNGYIFTRRGSGSYVAEQMNTISSEVDEKKDVLIDLAEEVNAEDIPTDVINMSSVSLNPEMISMEIFQKAIDEILKRDKGYAFTYQDSKGYLPLRQSIVQSLAQKKINTTQQNVQIISGAQQGIDIVARALLKHGDIVFVESPTYPGAMAAFRSCGAKIIDIKLTKEGIDLADLENKLKLFKPRLIYVMPNVQNPTGISYSKYVRHRLMGLARYHDVYILEDDYIGGLYYSKNEMLPLKTYDTDDRVIYIRTLSKVFMPGLRLAYLIVPSDLAQRLLNVKYISDIATSGLTQRIFDYYLREGLWQKHLNSIRSIYKTKFDLILKMMKKYLPKDISYIKPTGGLSVWLNLPERLLADDVIENAKKQGVIISNGAPFFVRRAPHRQLRISFAVLSLAEIKTGIKILAEIMK